MPRIELRAEAITGTNAVKLFVLGGRYPSKVVKVSQSVELYAQFRLYKKELVQKFGVSIETTMPNLYRAFVESRVIAAPPPFPPFPLPLLTYCTVCGKPGDEDNPVLEEHKAHDRCWIDANGFETNMVEALVGKKGWSLNADRGILLSHGGREEFPWLPGRKQVAKCANKCPAIPSTSCGCGIYAATGDSKDHLNYGTVRGEIYGWGRYIRGDNGWRSEFAYPKSFYLEENQMDYIEPLKKYGVPIFMNQPFRVYDPAEDGYEGESDEHRGTEEDGDCGTDEESDSD